MGLIHSPSPETGKFPKYLTYRNLINDVWLCAVSYVRGLLNLIDQFLLRVAGSSRSVLAILKGQVESKANPCQELPQLTVEKEPDYRTGVAVGRRRRN